MIAVDSRPYIGWTPLPHEPGCGQERWLVHERGRDVLDGSRLELRFVCSSCGAADLMRIDIDAGPDARWGVRLREATSTRRIGYGYPPRRAASLWLWPAPANHQEGRERDRPEPAGTGPEPMVHLAPDTGSGSDLDPDQKAVRAYQASIESGDPLSERKLAEQFGKSRRWARKIIAYVREGPASADAERSRELCTSPSRQIAAS